MIIDLFASIGFFLIPFIIGTLFTRHAFYAWISGILSIFFLFFAVFYTTSLFPQLDFLFLLRFFVIILFVWSLLVLILKVRQIRSLPRPSLWILGGGIFATMLYFFVWKQSTPYPLQLNWDIYEHITLANLLLKGHVSLLPSHISDTFTFNGYTPLFHMLLAVPAGIFGKGLVGIYWWLEYFFYLATILVSCLLAWRTTQNKWATAFTGVLAACVFESTIVYTSLFLIPQTLVALITLFAVSQILSEKKPNLLGWGATALVLFALHYIVGTFGIGACALFVLFKYKPIPIVWMRKGLIGVMILFGLVLCMHVFGGWALTGREEAAHFILPIEQTAGYFFDWYGLASIAVFLMGAFVLWTKGEKQIKLVLFLSIISLCIVFSPFSYVLKFYVIGRYFVNVVLGVGFAFLLFKSAPKWRPLVFVGISSVLFCIFFFNQLTYKSPLYFQGKYSHISQGEMQAAEWLKGHTSAGTLLISDPSTQYVLEALSGINTQGGAYMDESTREKLVAVGQTTNNAIRIAKLTAIHDLLPSQEKKTTQRIVVLSARYFAWQKLSVEEKESFFYNIWVPHLLTVEDKKYIEQFKKTMDVKEIYRNSEMVIIGYE